VSLLGAVTGNIPLDAGKAEGLDLGTVLVTGVTFRNITLLLDVFCHLKTKSKLLKIWKAGLHLTSCRCDWSSGYERALDLLLRCYHSEINL